MLFELGKAGSFVLCIVSLYSVLMSGFFEPNTTWEQRLMLGLSRLFVAGCVSFASGLVFSYPGKTNRMRAFRFGGRCRFGCFSGGWFDGDAVLDCLVSAVWGREQLWVQDRLL